jgi:predicted O-methyltransferase YrrM
MSLLSQLLNLILTALLFFALFHLYRYRKRVHAGRDTYRDAPIPAVRLADFDDLFKSDENGIARNAEVAFIGQSEGGIGLTSDAEAWILSVLAKRSLFMFEFGTASGRTTYLWARNSAPDAKVTTLTLHPDQHDLYKSDEHDNKNGSTSALHESKFTSFAYSGTPVENKISQLYGDSKQFDESPYSGRCDLIFIDGSHAYSYAKSDTQKALRMLKSHGVILWHDYRKDLLHTKGVYDFLNELHRNTPLVRLPGTSLVAFRR